jgi:predicted DNA-binding transcriptional regulator YafY
MADNFLRYLMLLREIPRAPRRVDTATLARRLEERGIDVTRRTLQRDLERLSATFPLACDDATKPYGWSWVDGMSRGEKPGPGSDRLRALGQVARDVSGQAPALRRIKGARELTVVLRFSDRAAQAAQQLEAQAQTFASRSERSGLRVEAAVRDCPELRSWLRSLGADVEVIAPQKLRTEFRTLAARLERIYKSR